MKNKVNIIISCKYCSSRSISISKKISSYSLFECQKCGLLFSQIEEERENVNNKIYNRKYLDNYENRKDSLLMRFKKRLEEIEERIPGGSILDNGCSTGMFLSTVKSYAHNNWRLVGVDLNSDSIRYAKSINSGITFIHGTLNEKKFPLESFDCITCFDVLEHDGALNETLNTVYKLLRKDGLFLIQSPNYRSIMADLCGNNWDWWSLPDHLFHFTPMSLSKILEAHGFKIIKVRTWDPPRDFVRNIQGTIRRNVTSKYYLNKVTSKLSLLPLYIFWCITLLHKELFKSGGLVIIYATK